MLAQALCTWWAATLLPLDAGFWGPALAATCPMARCVCCQYSFMWACFVTVAEYLL